MFFFFMTFRIVIQYHKHITIYISKYINQTYFKHIFADVPIQNVFINTGRVCVYIPIII